MRSVALSLLAMAACGTDDANVAGDYSVSLTYRDNGCNLGGNWTVGNTTTVQVTMVQSKADVTATVMGLGGVALDALLGAHAYTGKVNGNDLDLTIFGTHNATMGSCSYTINSELIATSHGDIVQGRVEYKSATNGSPDCAPIEGCLSQQDFNGTRPPP